MKLFVGLLAAMLMVSSANAQHVNMGIKGGLNFYHIHNDNNINYGTRTGLHAGLLWHIHMSEHFALQPEVVFSLQGANLPNNYRLNLGYVNVPFLFQFMVGNGFRFEVGPQVGFLVLAKSELRGTTEDVRDSFKPIDLAVAAGFGYVSASGFGFDARYNYGVNNFHKLGNVASSNQGFQLGILYQFHHH